MITTDVEELALDLETYKIRDNKQAPKPVVLSWYASNGDGGLITGMEDMLDAWEAALRSDARLIGHNLAFDMVVMMAQAKSADFNKAVFDAYDAFRVRDTMYCEKLIRLGTEGFGTDNYDPRRKNDRFFGLAELVKKYVGKDISEDKHGEFAWRTHYAYLDGVPLEEWPEKAKSYALDDTYLCYEVYQAQKEYREAPNGDILSADVGIKNSPRTADMALSLRLMSTWGLRTDLEYVEQLADKINSQYQILAGVAEEGGLFTRKSDGTLKKNMKALKAAVEEAYQNQLDQPAPTTSKGNIKTGKDIVKPIKSHSEAMDAYWEIQDGMIGKVRSTYLPIIKKGSIHPGYDALKSTGRSSSFSPNIQNIPRKGGVRDAFVARPGYVYVLCDYSTLEMRTWAQACLDLPAVGYSTVADVAREGRDFHDYYAAKFRGFSYEKQQADRAGENGPKLQKGAAAMRQFAKIPNYGIPGGMQNANSLVDYADNMGQTITVERAEEGIEFFYAAWPEIDDYFNYVENLCGWGEGCIKQIRSGRIRAGVEFTQAANSFFQGLAADGGREACNRIVRACLADKSSALFGSHPVAYIHDELIVEVPVDRAEQAALEVQRHMEEGMEQYTPDVPIEAEPALAARWYKGAEPVYDADGNLEVWVPFKTDDDGNFESFDPDALAHAQRHTGKEIKPYAQF